MPRIRTTQPETVQPLAWQQTVADRIRAGKLVPILSNGTGDDLVLGGHAALVQAYATYSGYTRGSPSLAEIAQFQGITDESLGDALALKENYVKWVKSRLFELAEADGADRAMLDEVDDQFDSLTLARMCNQLGYPHYGDERRHPLLLLAALDLPIYITTSYHEFLEAALLCAGKSPRTDFCRWHKNIEVSEKYPAVFDGSYEPSRQEPLVYHLHGLDRCEDSLVLTEDDHLSFLVACSQSFGKNTDPVHSRVRQALSDSSLLLLGYELQAWDFRSLFWGLIVQRTRALTSVMSIQLEPSQIEKLYLQKYLDGYDFKVSWGSVQDCLITLSKAVFDG